ncbi:MAG: hypothetical protein ATN35_00310 [Epulopiscium sp. Nele67-Bin004]|nr:MAG: hypothetical protein ATN35_00310 [Epulopiscium sp. Nele67-Bin004]
MNNPLDNAINTEFMLVVKCILPYLDDDIQKTVAIGIKALELIETFKLYDEETSPISKDKNGDWQKDLLLDVSKNLHPDKAGLLELLVLAGERKPPVTSYQHSYQPKQQAENIDYSQIDKFDPNTLLKTITPLLEPEQQQFISMLSNAMAN